MSREKGEKSARLFFSLTDGSLRVRSRLSSSILVDFPLSRFRGRGGFLLAPFRGRGGRDVTGKRTHSSVLDFISEEREKAAPLAFISPSPTKRDLPVYQLLISLFITNSIPSRNQRTRILSRFSRTLSSVAIPNTDSQLSHNLMPSSN